MAYQWATWMADALRGAGLHVVEHPGWRARGQDDGPFTPRAVMIHHDASAPGPSPSLPDYLADLSHPGAQCWVDTAGRWHLIAAGRMWHAGRGTGWGVIPTGAGNTYSIGVETDHTVGERWPAEQLSGLRRGVAALCEARGWNPGTAVAGHKEYRRSNPDPDGIDMNDFRRAVADAMGEDMPSIEEIRAAIADVGLQVVRREGISANAHTAAASGRAAVAEIGALRATVTALSDGGGLTAAEVQAAAEAGARAALDELGEALTGDDADA